MCWVCDQRARPMSDAKRDEIEFEVLCRAASPATVHRFSEVQRYIFRNALVREGIQRAKQFIRDWKLVETQAWITKWVPGDHYYAEGEKFDHYSDAERHLKLRGFNVLGLKEIKVPIPPKEGD